MQISAVSLIAAILVAIPLVGTTIVVFNPSDTRTIPKSWVLMGPLIAILALMDMLLWLLAFNPTARTIAEQIVEKLP